MPDRARTDTRPLWTVVGALALGAATLWGASRLGWSGGARGADSEPALVPLAVLALAGIAGLYATGGWPRRVLAGLLCAAGIGACVLAAIALLSAGKPLGGPVLAAVGGVLIGAAGVVAIRSADRMPRMGARYQKPQVDKVGADPEADLWNALSEGEDPTARE